VIQYKQTNFFFLFIPSLQKLAIKTKLKSILLQLHSLLPTCFVAPSVGSPALPLHYFYTTPCLPRHVQRQIWRSKQLEPAGPTFEQLHLQSTHADTNTWGKTLAARRFPLTSTVHTYIQYRHCTFSSHWKKEKRDGLLCLETPWTSSPQFHALAVLGDGASRKPHSPQIRDGTHWLFSPTFSFLTRRFLLRPLARLS
jgi:hypothetical protein